MSTLTRDRRPTGSPVGGQFAPQSRTEVIGLDLAPIQEALFPAGWESLSADRRPALTESDEGHRVEETEPPVYQPTLPGLIRTCRDCGEHEGTPFCGPWCWFIQPDAVE